MFRLWFFLLISHIISINFVESLFGYTHKYNTHEDPAIPHTNRNLAPYTIPEEKWIVQPLDHFDPQNSIKWNMRYYELNTHFQPGGPILIYVGGEWAISPASINQGSLIFDISRELNGTLFYTEHRYYGKSHPTANTSTENLKFLSVDQALADVAFFINKVKASSIEYKDSGVILAGGSYSGELILSYLLIRLCLLMHSLINISNNGRMDEIKIPSSCGRSLVIKCTSSC